jgi:tRNA threonylcarbamoyladenosine biosynthesis protein TsaE
MKKASFSFISSSASETTRFGARLGQRLKRGDVVLLMAPLGAGKTTLVQGVARALGVKEMAQSPTFVLAQTHQGKIPLHHLDFYRLNKKDILDMGIHDYLTGAGEIPPGVVFIEWADRCKEVWPADRLEIVLKMKPRSHAREIIVTGIGDRFQQLVKRVAA